MQNLAIAKVIYKIKEPTSSLFVKQITKLQLKAKEAFISKLFKQNSLAQYT